ncbi:hypothetical protein LEP1GSC021_2172 [Leptospira noguchii str. 1993005606]|nr:hypothetical protein LEP1GSC021_2172 [Leptospira noguchii str. 1993005606]
MIPKFREGNYFQGISDGIDAVMTKINGEELSQTNKIPKFFEVINEYSIYIFPTFVSIIVIISVLISIGIFGTIGLAGILIFIEYIWESIILGIGILILLILCFSMTVYLKKKMRRKSFWDYIIVSVYISLVIFGTIGLIGVLFFYRTHIGIHHIRNWYFNSIDLILFNDGVFKRENTTEIFLGLYFVRRHNFIFRFFAFGTE